MPTILLLLLRNIFMTGAWDWHLKGGMTKPLLILIALSWSIALVGYCFAVPANRIGFAAGWSGAFMVTVRSEPLHWRHAAVSLCLVLATGLLFVGNQCLSCPGQLTNDKGH